MPMSKEELNRYNNSLDSFQKFLEDKNTELKRYGEQLLSLLSTILNNDKMEKPKEFLDIIRFCGDLNEQKNTAGFWLLSALLNLLKNIVGFKSLVTAGESFAQQLQNPGPSQPVIQQVSSAPQPTNPVEASPSSPKPVATPSPTNPIARIMKPLNDELPKTLPSLNKCSTSTQSAVKEAAKTCHSINQEKAVSPKNLNDLASSVKKLEKAPEPAVGTLAKVGGVVLGALFVSLVAVPAIALAVATDGKSLEALGHGLELGANISNLCIGVCDNLSNQRNISKSQKETQQQPNLSSINSTSTGSTRSVAPSAESQPDKAQPNQDEEIETPKPKF